MVRKPQFTCWRIYLKGKSKPVTLVLRSFPLTLGATGYQYKPRIALSVSTEFPEKYTIAVKLKGLDTTQNLEWPSEVKFRFMYVFQALFCGVCQSSSRADSEQVGSSNKQLCHKQPGFRHIERYISHPIFTVKYSYFTQQINYSKNLYLHRFPLLSGKDLPVSCTLEVFLLNSAKAC